MPDLIHDCKSQKWSSSLYVRSFLKVADTMVQMIKDVGALVFVNEL